MVQYHQAFSESINHPERFWAQAAAGIDWFKSWDNLLDASNPPFYRWFQGGLLNTCYNAVDRHVESGRGEQPAIIYDSPVTETLRVISYRQLQTEVARVAGGLKKLGVTAGDTVIIYLPMIPEAAYAMLACARLGAVHSVVFGGFAANELAIRINDARPAAIITASGAIEGNKILAYKPIVDEAIRLAEHQVSHCVVYQRDFVEASLVPGRDHDWLDLLEQSQPADWVPVAATAPLYILYTSGTTGRPKGVLRDHGGHAVALHWSMKAVYDIDPGEVFWSASDVGWVVGHSYIVYGPLLKGATTVLYEGKPVGTPDAGAFWRVISQHRVKCLFTAPTAFRAIKKEDPNGTLTEAYDLSCFEALYLAGERLDPDTFHWATRLLRVPVIDHWWQTETGWAIVANCRGLEFLPLKPGSPSKPVPGYHVQVLDGAGRPTAPGTEGNIVVKLPLPPGTLVSLWRDDQRFVNSYLSTFPGYYETSDGGYIDEDGYVFVMGRMDDVINVAGHRLSTGAMEEVIATHPDVAECAVIGTEHQLKGQLPVGLFVLKSGCRRDAAEVAAELVTLVREQIGAVACFREATMVGRLPKTRSGKILRGTMRAIASGREYRMPSTIDDPLILEEISHTLRSLGYPQTREPGP